MGLPSPESMGGAAVRRDQRRLDAERIEEQGHDRDHRDERGDEAVLDDVAPLIAEKVLGKQTHGFWVSMKHAGRGGTISGVCERWCDEEGLLLRISTGAVLLRVARLWAPREPGGRQPLEPRRAPRLAALIVDRVLGLLERVLQRILDTERIRHDRDDRHRRNERGEEAVLDQVFAVL